MYYMTYNTIVTSKGTITIAAPLRKALGLKTGQKLTLTLNASNQVVLDAGTDLKTFEATRASIAKKIPSHLKGLAGDSLREAAANAWVASDKD
jgi:bifunctional DNA-binding transcriptional regulator/antitoxin component of YhaV-PrlF toxin-antitoxin module